MLFSGSVKYWNAGKGNVNYLYFAMQCHTVCWCSPLKSFILEFVNQAATYLIK